MMEKKLKSERLVANIAKQAGVSDEDAAKVLKTLGLDGLTANIGAAGIDLGKIDLGDLKLAARIGRGGVMV